MCVHLRCRRLRHQDTVLGQASGDSRSYHARAGRRHVFRDMRHRHVEQGFLVVLDPMFAEE